MNVFGELEREKILLRRIQFAADKRACLGFADLVRGGDDLDAYRRRVQSEDNPGVKFTTRTRIVVFEFHFGQLRYYAGGCAPEEQLAEEDIRIQSEGYETGDFFSVRDAMRFAEAYWVDALSLQDIKVERRVVGSRETAEKKA